MENKILSRKEKVSFSIATFGRSTIYNLMSIYMLVFFVDVVQIDVVVASGIILFARIFDAANDLLMGIIVDHTHSRWGKMRPYLLFSPFIIAVATILLFYSPGLSESGKVIYCAATYVLWGLAFTIQDVPHWGLTSVITPNEEERNGLISMARVMATIGSLIPTMIVPMLIESFGLKNGYFYAGLFFAIAGSGISLLAFFNCKERIIQTKQPTKVKVILNSFIKNKPLLLLLLSTLLSSTIILAQTSAAYIGNYLIIDSMGIPKGMILTLMSIAVGAGMLPAIGIIVPLRKRFSLKEIYLGACVFGIFTHGLVFIIGYSNIYILLTLFVFIGVPLGIFNAITYMMVADSVDYTEYITGTRIEGISFAIQTFMAKVTAGIATFITGLVLNIIEFKAPVEIGGVLTPITNQGPQVRNGLFWLITLLPLAGYILATVPMFFYNYTGKNKEKIQNELQLRREELSL